MTSTSPAATTTFRPVETLGDVLVGRDSAAELRERVERRVEIGENVILDFAGVSLLAPSFADELLAKLPAGTLGGRVRVEHLDASSAALVRVAIAARR